MRRRFVALWNGRGQKVARTRSAKNWLRRSARSISPTPKSKRRSRRWKLHAALVISRPRTRSAPNLVPLVLLSKSRRTAPAGNENSASTCTCFAAGRIAPARVTLLDRATCGAEIQRVAGRPTDLLIPLLLQVARFGNGNLLVSRELGRGLRHQGSEAGDRGQDQIDRRPDSSRQNWITDVCRLKKGRQVLVDVRDHALDFLQCGRTRVRVVLVVERCQQIQILAGLGRDVLDGSCIGRADLLARLQRSNNRADVQGHLGQDRQI